LDRHSPNFSESLEKIGINTDGVSTNDIAGVLRPDIPMSEEAKAIVQSGVNNIYQRFLSIVAEARESTPEHIHTIAQGRIWSGAKAQELGLVDELGSLEDLYKSIAEDLDLADYEIKAIARELSFQEQFFQALMEQAHVAGFKALFDENSVLGFLTRDSQMTEQLDMFTQAPTRFGQSVYAACQFCVEL